MLNYHLFETAECDVIAITTSRSETVTLIPPETKKARHHLIIRDTTTDVLTPFGQGINY